MCTFKITNDPNQTILDQYLKLGGPTASKTINVGGVYITHNLLSITGEVVVQPVKYGNKYYMLLGEIYNYDDSWDSDIYFGIEKYLEHGDKFTEYLDGEFLFIVYDLETKIIDLFTDPWSTRQCFYYKVEEHFYFSTFPMREPEDGRFNKEPSIDPVWNNEFFRIPHNSHYRYDVISNKLTPINTELHEWNLIQYKDNLDDVISAFEAAVLKRYTDNITLFLSGGLDSSSIAMCLADHKKHFNSITLSLNDSEDNETIQQVLEYTKPYNTNYKITENNELTDKTYIENRNFLRESKCRGRSQLRMRETVISKFNSKVVFMGNGGDEIVESYMTKDKSDFSIWPEDLTTIFPWKHFYGGQTRRLLDLHETLSLAYGLELRNIFYDKSLTQEWLHIVPEIKNQTPKVFQKLYFYNRGIKLPEKISGFGSQVRDNEYTHLKPTPYK